MFADQRVLCLIPARGGSKGLPHKNLAPLRGKPLIAWTIAAAKGSSYVDDTIVTTDDEAIARVAVASGAEVPFLRPAKLASDEAHMSDVVRHALDTLARSGRSYHWLLLLQPTAPLRTTTDIDAAFDRLRTSGGSAVVSVCEAEHSPLWMGQLPEDGNMAAFADSIACSVNRQELDRYYRLNGSIYLSEVGYWRSQSGFLGPTTFAIVMRQDASVDVDSRLDLDMAELLLTRREGQG